VSKRLMGSDFPEAIDLDANFVNPSMAENADEEMLPIDLDKPLLFFSEDGL
jgi:hypothetical protein